MIRIVLRAGVNRQGDRQQGPPASPCWDVSSGPWPANVRAIWAMGREAETNGALVSRRWCQARRTRSWLSIQQQHAAELSMNVLGRSEAAKEWSRLGVGLARKRMDRRFPPRPLASHRCPGGRASGSPRCASHRAGRLSGKRAPSRIGKRVGSLRRCACAFSSLIPFLEGGAAPSKADKLGSSIGSLRMPRSRAQSRHRCRITLSAAP